jgi:hypothetical protein
VDDDEVNVFAANERAEPRNVSGNRMNALALDAPVAASAKPAEAHAPDLYAAALEALVCVARLVRYEGECRESAFLEWSGKTEDLVVRSTEERRMNDG